MSVAGFRTRMNKRPPSIRTRPPRKGVSRKRGVIGGPRRPCRTQLDRSCVSPDTVPAGSEDPNYQAIGSVCGLGSAMIPCTNQIVGKVSWSAANRGVLDRGAHQSASSAQIAFADYRLCGITLTGLSIHTTLTLVLPTQ